MRPNLEDCETLEEYIEALIDWKLGQRLNQKPVAATQDSERNALKPQINSDTSSAVGDPQWEAACLEFNRVMAEEKARSKQGK